MRQAVGPVVTLGVVLLIHFLSGYISISFGFALVALTWTAYISGIVPTVISSVIIVAFMSADYPPDYSRLVQGVLTVIFTGSLVIILKRQAVFSQTLNGNLKKLGESLNITRSLLDNWADLSDAGRYKRIQLIEDKLGNLAALVHGWHSIHKEIEETRAELEDSGPKP